MLDMSNYSKTAIKMIKSPKEFADRVHLCARAKWFCVAAARAELQGGSWIPQQADGKPPCSCGQHILPPWRWGVGHVRGVTDPIHLWQPGRGWISSLPSHWAHRSWGLGLAQLLWGGIKPILRNPESWISTQYCVIRETDTASQCETDPAPDELGE